LRPIPDALPANPRVELRLTVRSSFSVSATCQDEPSVAEAPERGRLIRVGAVPGEASSKASSAPYFPAAALSTGTEHAAPPLTSLSRTLRFEPDLSVGSLPLSARFRLHRRLVKDRDFVETRTPSIDEVLSPPLRHVSSARLAPHAVRRRPALSCRPPARCPLAQSPEQGERDLREPATVSAFRGPASSARSRLRRGWIRRFSSTSAIRTAHEHNHEPSESPVGRRRSGTPSSRWAWRVPPDGVEAPSAVSAAKIRVAPRCLPSRKPCGLSGSFLPGTNRASSGQGQSGRSLPAPPCASLGRTLPRRQTVAL
jgi:hypothetical protein